MLVTIFDGSSPGGVTVTRATHTGGARGPLVGGLPLVPLSDGGTETDTVTTMGEKIMATKKYFLNLWIMVYLKVLKISF